MLARTKFIFEHHCVALAYEFVPYFASLECTVVVAEWLRRWTRNPMGSPRTGSNPVYDVFFFYAYSILLFLLRKTNKFFRKVKVPCSPYTVQTNQSGPIFLHLSSYMLVTLYDQYCVHVYKVLFWNVYKTDIK